MQIEYRLESQCKRGYIDPLSDSWLLSYWPTIFTRNDATLAINFTAVEGGDNSSYAGSEAREVFINTSSGISGVNK